MTATKIIHKLALDRGRSGSHDGQTELNCKTQWQFRPLIGLSVITLLVVLSPCSWGQTTKQLKDPKRTNAPVKIIEKQNEAGSFLAPSGSSPINKQSYSVVIESHTTPDGKIVRVKKVWKDGKLLEESEEEVDQSQLDEPQIILPDGKSLKGQVLRSEQFGDFPHDLLNGNPEELAKAFQERMQRQLNEQRQLFGLPAVMPQGALIPGQANSFANAKPLSQYWLGAAVQPVTPFVSAQLDLPNGEGVLVLKVVPNSPADRAGLKALDLLYKLNGTILREGTQIGELLDQSKGEKVSVDLYRRGKALSVTLTPEKRPDSSALLGNDEAGSGSDESQSVRVVRPGLIIQNKKGRALAAPTEAKSNVNSSEK